MPFQSGEEWQKSGGNAKGRVPGSRNKRTQEILDLIQSRGDKDPLDFLSEVISSENHYTVDQKISAANYLNPYLHSKRSVLVDPRFIETPVQVPEFQSIEEAEAYLASLPAKLGRGEVDFEVSEKISLLTRNYIETKIDAEKLRLQIASQGGEREQTIHITGGLPPLPATNIIMPELNGRAIDGEVVKSIPEMIAPESTSQPEDPEP
jgi:hypothetical protein